MSLTVRSEDEQVRQGPVSDSDALQLCRVADQVVDQTKDQGGEHQTIVHCFTSLFVGMMLRLGTGVESTKQR